MCDLYDLHITYIYKYVCAYGRPGKLQPMGSQRVVHDWATEQQQLIHTHADILLLFSH